MIRIGKKVFVSAYAKNKEGSMPSIHSLDAELNTWHLLWNEKKRSLNKDEKLPDTISRTLAQTDRDMFPNIDKIRRIIGTLPITSCECEL